MMDSGQTSRTAHPSSNVEGQKICNVMFLCNEWKSSKGGLSTFNREFAVNLAKTTTETIKVHCYVSQSDELDREDARQHGVNLITAESIPGSADPLDWLKIPPPELPHPDVVVGHGRKFGTSAFFIVRAAKCKWVHFVHVFCEDLGKFKLSEGGAVDTIEENEKKHKSEIELCRAANAVVAVGSRLQQKYSRSLPGLKVEVVTPGILQKFSSETTQLTTVAKKFNVFMFGRATFEDLTLKGYDVIANAIGCLGKKYVLTFVGSPTGGHRKIEQWFLDNTCISRNQITIRSYCNEQDELKTMFRESDLVALPSRTEGFGLVALEAISAGIPVLVTDESGIAEALEKVDGGESVIVESEDAGEWAQRIQQLSSQSPKERENNAKLLRENYKKTYSWSTECKKFERIIQDLVGQPHITSNLNDPQTCVSRSSEVPEPFYADFLENKPSWYFGKVTRKDAETMLHSYCPGTFLVRDSESDPRPGIYVLSQMHRDGCQHHKIETLHDGYLALKGCEDRCFPSLAALVYYFRSQEEDLKLVPLVKEKSIIPDSCESATVLVERPGTHSAVKRDKTDIDKLATGRGLLQSHSPGSVVATINQTTLDVNVDKGETQSTENEDWKFLHSAVKGGNVAIIETMLSRGLDVNSKDSNGDTPLMIAAFSGKMEAVNYLLDKGADMSLTGMYGRNLLHNASDGGNVAIIETMLSRGLDVNSKDSDGDTPLMIAAFSGKMEAVHYLLDKGADMSLTGKYGRNLLHNASEGGNVAIIKTMLSRGLDINSKDSNGDTPLMIAAFCGKMEAVNYLLDKGADMSLTGKYGRNLLHNASVGGNVAIIETMLSRGLDVNSKDSDGDTPIMIAAFSGKMEAVNYLLDKGADMSLTGKYGRNLLHKASSGGNVAIIKAMLSRGLDINSKDSNGDTPLMIAALRGKMEVVNYLLDKGADMSLTGKYGRNLLHNASVGGNVAIIETMLSRGLDVNSKDSDGDTPTMIAAFSGKMEAVNYLLDKGADMSLTGKYGRNLLHKASSGGNVAIIETMLSRGLDINSKDSDGYTPLMIAALWGKMEAVNYLLDKGADMSLTGKYGRNLLHKASYGGNVAIIETMLSRGLDINSKDNNGSTPLTIAAARGHAEAVNFLLSRGAR